MVELGASRRGGGLVVSVAFALAMGGCGSDGGPAGSAQMGGTGGTAAGGRPDPAFAIFDNTRLHEIAITMAPEDWQSILDDSRGDEDRHATFSYDGAIVDDVGVHPSGETSRFAGNPKMSVRIKFDAFPDRGKFGGVSEIKLKGQWDDPSMMRDGLAKFVYRAAAPTGQEAYAHLTVNGADRGLYAVVEVWDKDALLAHHFREPVGPLYRIRGFAPPADPYALMGSDPAAYMPLPWEPHINHPAVGDQVIVNLTTTLANNPAQVETVIDMDTLRGFWPPARWCRTSTAWWVAMACRTITSTSTPPRTSSSRSSGIPTRRCRATGRRPIAPSPSTLRTTR